VKSGTQSSYDSTDDGQHKIALFEAEYDRIRGGEKFDEVRLLKLFDFDVDEKGKSKLVNALKLCAEHRALYVSPGGLTLLRLHNLLAAGKLPEHYGAKLSKLLDGLFRIMERSVAADEGKDAELATLQLEALDRIAWPNKHSVSPGVIREIASINTNDSLARGRELIELMGRISYVVEAKKGREIIPTRTIVKRQVSPHTSDIRTCGQSLWVYVKNDDHWTPQATIQSLAITIFQARLKDEGIAQFDPATLKADIKKAIAWDKAHPGPRVRWMGARWGVEIESSDFSQGWKSKRRDRQGS